MQIKSPSLLKDRSNRCLHDLQYAVEETKEIAVVSADTHWDADQQPAPSFDELYYRRLDHTKAHPSDDSLVFGQTAHNQDCFWYDVRMLLRDSIEPYTSHDTQGMLHAVIAVSTDDIECAFAQELKHLLREGVFGKSNVGQGFQVLLRLFEGC